MSIQKTPTWPTIGLMTIPYGNNMSLHPSTHNVVLSRAMTKGRFMRAKHSTWNHHNLQQISSPDFSINLSNFTPPETNTAIENQYIYSWKTYFLLKYFFFRGYVYFPGCISKKIQKYFSQTLQAELGMSILPPKRHQEKGGWNHHFWALRWCMKPPKKWNNHGKLNPHLPVPYIFFQGKPIYQVTRLDRLVNQINGGQGYEGKRNTTCPCLANCDFCFNLFYTAFSLPTNMLPTWVLVVQKSKGAVGKKERKMVSPILSFAATRWASKSFNKKWSYMWEPLRMAEKHKWVTMVNWVMGSP